MMPGMVGLVNAVALLAVLIGEPAPRRIGPVEWVMIAASLVGAGMAVRLAFRTRTGGGNLRPGLFLPLLFVLPVLQSTLVAWVRNVPGESVFRSVAPYVVFLPVAFLGLAGERPGKGRAAIRGLVVGGLMQAGFLLALYVTTGGRLSDPDAVRYARITLLDPRTTSPLVLGLAILPWAWWPAARSVAAKVGIVVGSSAGALAAASTQTRSMILAVVVGGALAIGGALAFRREGAVAGWGRRAAGGLVAAMVALAVLGLWAPPVNALLRAIVARSEIDRDTGRVDDEWTPAVATMLDGGVATVVLGVGSGESYVTAGGEERTYVHNLTIYGLLYFGVLGLAVLVFGYVLLGGLLARRAIRTRDAGDWALAALLVAMFLYAQFFAVHKLLSYNLMLMLILQAFGRGPEPAEAEAR